MLAFGAWLVALVFALAARRARWAHVALLVLVMGMVVANGAELLAAWSVRP